MKYKKQIFMIAGGIVFMFFPFMLIPFMDQAYMQTGWIYLFVTFPVGFIVIIWGIISWIIKLRKNLR